VDDLLGLVWALLVGTTVTSAYAVANGTLSSGRLTGRLFNPNTLAAELVIVLNRDLPALLGDPVPP
jgi:hypothetical protein